MKDKRILLIGGTGSWGAELLEQLLKNQVAQIKLFSRNEHNMVTLRQEFQDERILIALGDIRDKERLMQACAKSDIIFHLAALKHVPICEQMPTEAVATNVVGTRNVIDCAIASGVEKVIYVSTDKAVSPDCVYGCTKLLGEKLILSANEESVATKFIVFRSGNLLASSGSVIPLFQQQIAQSQSVNLTARGMNRFFITTTKASNLLIEVAMHGVGGEIFLPNMGALSIYNIAKYLLAKNGLDETQIKIIGLRPGERLNEAMATEDESQSIFRLNETLSVLLAGDMCKRSGLLERNGGYCFRSQDATLSYEETKRFLQSANI